MGIHKLEANLQHTLYKKLESADCWKGYV